MTSNDLIGRVVYSKSGRDEDRAFIIVNIIDENYVYISDGDLRPFEKPKKKKVKHLNITDITVEEFSTLFEQGDKISNREIKRFLQSMNSNKEV